MTNDTPAPRSFAFNNYVPWIVDGLFPHDDQPMPGISGTLEVRPCRYEDAEREHVLAGTRAEPQGADFWTVYVRDDNGLATAIADMPNARAADSIAEALHAAYPGAFRLAPPPHAPLLRSSVAETAACIWDAVIDLRHDQSQQVGRDIEATFEAFGTGAIRGAAMDWIDPIEAAWLALDDDSIAFDFEFVPGWIVANVDWSDSRHPHMRPPVAAAAPPSDLFGVMVGFGSAPTSALIPETFTSYDAAQAEATSRANAPGWWACVYQLQSGGQPVVHFAPIPIMEPGTTIAATPVAADDMAEGEETPTDIACELAEVVEAIAVADARTDAPAFAAALGDAVKLLARIGVTVPDADNDAEADAVSVVVDALDLLDRVQHVTAGSNGGGSFELDDGATYLFTVERSPLRN